MRYTSEQINKMSWQEWNETMAEELNRKGFKAHVVKIDEHGALSKGLGDYEAGDDPKLFVLGTIEDSEAISYLKDIGLLNNGRCPMCGGPIHGNPGRFTSGYDSNFHFQICQNCVNSKGGMRRVVPASGGGCLVALILFPWYLVKYLF